MGGDGLRVVLNEGFLHHKRTGEGAPVTSIASNHVYSRQIGARLRANHGHDGTGRSTVRFRPKQELSCLISIFLDVSALVSRELG